MSQVDAELRRFFARRLVRGTVLLIVLIALVSIGIQTGRGHPGHGSAGFVPVTAATRLDQNGRQQQVVYSSGGQVSDTRIDVGRSLEDTLHAMAIVMLFVSIILGASFVGADFNVGSLTSQLLFESRRWRVHLAKAIAVAIGCAAVAALICVAIGALIYGGSELHGVVRGIGATWWRHRGVDLVRAIGTASAAGVMAYSVTLVAHRTTAGIVAFLAQFPFIIIVDEHSGVFGPISRYAPFRALMAITGDVNGAANSELGIRTNAGAIVFTVVWVVILLGVSGAIFSRSEVR